MSEQDGGPAMPTYVAYHPGAMRNLEGAAGMSLRDRFALEALHLFVGSNAGSEDKVPDMMRSIARMSYLYADAMLRARRAA